MLEVIHPKHKFRRFEIDTIDIEVVSVFDLCAMQFTAADEKVDQPIEVREAGLPYGVEELIGTRHKNSLAGMGYRIRCPAELRSAAQTGRSGPT